MSVRGLVDPSGTQTGTCVRRGDSDIIRHIKVHLGSNLSANPPFLSFEAEFLGFSALAAEFAPQCRRCRFRPPPRFLMQFVSGTHEGGGGGGDRDRRLSEMREREREVANLGVNFIDAERASAA